MNIYLNLKVLLTKIFKTLSLLDIDSINNTTCNPNIDIKKCTGSIKFNFRRCDFDAVNEIIDIKSFISILKRFMINILI
jgi:hypothetical protein